MKLSGNIFNCGNRVRIELKNLVEIGYLEDPCKVGIDAADSQNAVIVLYLPPCIDQQPQHLRGKKSYAGEIHDDLFWSGFLHEIS